MKKPQITVVIPVYNEESEIKKCLQSLDDQKNANFEVILVDDGSTDKTLSIITSFEPGNYKLKILRQSHEGPAKARNFGASKAKGEILVFVDADMTFANDFLEKLTAPIVKNKAIGTHCDKEFVSNWDNVWARFWNYNQGIWTKSRLSGRVDQSAVFRAIKKIEFDKVKGFDIGGYTDDLSLVKKLSINPYSVHSTNIYHTNPNNLSEVFYQARWSAKREYKLGKLGILLSVLKYSPLASLVLGLLKLLRIRNPLFLIFKLVYDAGCATGIIEYKILGRSGSK